MKLRAKYAEIMLKSPRLLKIREYAIDVLVVLLVPFCAVFLLFALPYAYFQVKREQRDYSEMYANRDRGWN